MCEEELVVLYNRDHVYYCKRQQFGLGSEDAKKAHKIIQTLEKDGNKIIDIEMLTSEEINGLLEDIDQEINFFMNVPKQTIAQTNLEHLNKLQKTKDEIAEILNRRRKM